MAADTKNARMTEIDHINGYLIQLAERQNVPAPHHKMLREMVKFTTEVTGLRRDTSLGTRTRLTRRKMDIDDRVRDTQSRRLMFEEVKLQKEHERDTARDRIRRRQGLSSKRRQLQDSPEEDVSDPILVKAQKAGKRTERKSAPSPVDSKANEDMLAHLDELAESVRPMEDDDSPARDRSESKVEEQAQSEGSEAEKEAIKALEDRILGGGFGKRRF
jgi:hypothetical protein